MDFDVTSDESEFMRDALDAYTDAFPEYSPFAKQIIRAIRECTEAGCTLHLNMEME